MKKLLFFILILFANPVIAEDTKKPFKYSDGTIEQIVAWQKLAECAAFFNVSAKFLNQNSDERGQKYFENYEIAFFSAKEILKNDRKIDDDAALSIMLKSFDLEVYGTQSSLDYYSSNGKLNIAANKYIEESFAPCAEFTLANMKNKL